MSFDLNQKYLTASKALILGNKSVVLKFSMYQKCLKGLLRHRLLGPLQVFDLVVQEWGPRICISKKCSCHGNIAFLRTAL